MSLRIVPLPVEQAKVPVFRVVCSRAPKALASQDTWVLRGAACRRVVRIWNTAWHHYAPTGENCSATAPPSPPCSTVCSTTVISSNVDRGVGEQRRLRQNNKRSAVLCAVASVDMLASAGSLSLTLPLGGDGLFPSSNESVAAQGHGQKIGEIYRKDQSRVRIIPCWR